MTFTSGESCVTLTLTLTLNLTLTQERLGLIDVHQRQVASLEKQNKVLEVRGAQLKSLDKERNENQI